MIYVIKIYRTLCFTHTYLRFIKMYLIKTNIQRKHKMLCNSLYIIKYQHFR